MLEEIIAKLLYYLGDNYGYDFEDLKTSCGLTQYETERCEEILADWQKEHSLDD